MEFVTDLTVGKVKTRFLVDTGSDVSIIKKKMLKSFLWVNIDEKVILKGITNGKVESLETIHGGVFVTHKTYEQKFHSVENDFSIDQDGILGTDFLTENNLTIKFGKDKFGLGKLTFIRDDITGKVGPELDVLRIVRDCV